MVDIGHEETELILRETEREVRQVYLRAQSETQAKLDDYLSRFATKDAIKKRQLKEGKITPEEYKRWRKGQICIGQRWQEMVDTLSQDYVNADKLAMSIVRGHTPEAYAINHNYATFQIERDSWVNTSYTLYDRQTVERLIRDNPDLLPRPKVDIPKDKRWNKTHIKNEILQGILQGEDLRQVSKRLQKVTDMDNRAAMRNARTAMTGAQNAGRVDAYKRAKAMGIKLEQEWLATLDGRTRHSHRQMDGQHVEVGEVFSNKCRFPGDPEGPPWEVYNCRCTLVPRIAGVDQSDAPRDSRLGGMTYEEWKDEHKKSRSTQYSFDGFSGSVSSVFGQEDIDTMRDMLGKCGNEDVKMLFSRRAHKVTCTMSDDGDYTDPSGIVHINGTNAGEKSFTNTPFKVVFHEMVHSMDHFMYDDDQGYWSYYYEKSALTKAIKSDYKSSIAKILEEYRATNTSYDKPGSASEIKHALADIIGKGGNLPFKAHQWSHGMEFADTINVSDIMEFASGIAYPLSGGHGKQYWKAAKGAGAAEFMAEYISDMVASPASASLMERVFPEACTIAREMVKEMARWT